jgi:hypothetical protein
MDVVTGGRKCLANFNKHALQQGIPLCIIGAFIINIKCICYFKYINFANMLTLEYELILKINFKLFTILFGTVERAFAYIDIDIPSRRY